MRPLTNCSAQYAVEHLRVLATTVIVVAVVAGCGTDGDVEMSGSTKTQDVLVRSLHRLGDSTRHVLFKL